MVEKLTRKEIIVKLLRNEHEMREDNIVLQHKEDKNLEKYCNAITGETKRFNRVMREIENYFEVI